MNTFLGTFGIISRVRLQLAHLFAIIWTGIKLNTDGDSYMSRHTVAELPNQSSLGCLCFHCTYICKVYALFSLMLFWEQTIA